MSAVKVKSTATGPRIIKATRVDTTPPVTYEPDLVRVRACDRGGFYGVREVMKDPRTGRHEIVRNAIIRKPGDVFDMDTADMRTLPLAPGEHPHLIGEAGYIEIETARGQFELPSWVTLEEGVEETVPQGHKTSFGKQNGAVL